MFNKIRSLFTKKEVQTPLASKSIKRNSEPSSQTILPKTENENFTVIQMPELSNNVDAYKLTKWLVANNQVIKEGDILAEIETDKATMEFESYQPGRVEIVAKESTVLKVGEVIAKIHHQ